MKIYDTNLIALARQLIPPVLRKPIIMSFIDSLIEPLRTLHIQLVEYRLRIAYKLSITPQVCYLEKLLNDRYDEQYRRIIITDGFQLDEDYIYLNVESKVSPIYLNTENTQEYIFLQVEPDYEDFIVKYPGFINMNLTEASVLLDKNKLPCKQFKFQLL